MTVPGKKHVYICFFSALLLTVLSVCQSPLFAQYVADPVIVTASRLHSLRISTLREAFVLDKDLLERLPAASVTGLLEFMGAVDVISRSPDGVQADFGIRGASFEQVLIMVDGVRINDPQTGHHNSDFPVSVADIERIEVIPGHSSALYGPDAFGGIINIITSRPRQNKTRLAAGSGSYGRYAGSFSHAFAAEGRSAGMSLEHRHSDGHRHGSDYRITNGSLRSHLDLGGTEIVCQLGATVKDYGADGFYAPYPSREKIEHYFSRVSVSRTLSPRFLLHIQAYLRSHYDDFILDEDDPSLFRGRHRSRAAGLELSLNRISGACSGLAAGLETVYEDMESATMGDHRRLRAGLFAEMLLPVGGKTVVDLGGRLDVQEVGGIQANPSLGIRYQATQLLAVRAAVGRAFRTPTFTERYYTSPANRGDPHLRPEYSWSMETGISLGKRAEMTLFKRYERDRIDWTASGNGDPWQARNIGSLRVSGVSMQSSGTASWGGWKSSYTFLVHQASLDEGYVSKYALHIPRHRFTLVMFSRLIAGTEGTVTFVYTEKTGADPHLLAGLKIGRSFGRLRVYGDFRNLFNTVYEYLPGIPMPGFNFSLGTELEL